MWICLHVYIPIYTSFYIYSYIHIHIYIDIKFKYVHEYL